jgi:hypothetical protein
MAKKHLLASGSLLAILLFLMGCSNNSDTPEDNTAWYKDSQTEFTINSANQLAGLAELVNGGNNFEGKTVKLGANIILDYTEEWSPIGVVDNPFNGIFDGNGFVVSGAYMNSVSELQGLFGYIDSSGVVKNIGIVDSYFEGGYAIGGLAGVNRGTISNSYSASIVESSSRSRAGGAKAKPQRS